MTSARDLAEKIWAELSQYREAQDDDWLAFNLAVSIAHWPEWTNNADRFRQIPSFVICLQLANGAKHFKRNPQVRDRFPVESTSLATVVALSYGVPGEATPPATRFKAHAVHSPSKEPCAIDQRPRRLIHVFEDAVNEICRELEVTTTDLARRSGSGTDDPAQ